MIHLLVKIATVITLGFGSIIALAYLLQGRMIFIQSKGVSQLAEDFKPHEIVFERQDAKLHGWLVRPSEIDRAEPLLIYYGGNAEELSGNLVEFRSHGIQQYLMINYRGYGNSTGVPSERQLVADALHIFDQIIATHQLAPENIILMGRSLGTGVAVKVASLRHVGGVILVTPFDSLVNVAKSHYPFLPVNLLIKHRFDSLALAPQVKRPMLALIAGQDEIIPAASSQNLVKNWAGPLQSVSIPAAGHNDIQQYPDFWQAIGSFLEQVKHNQTR